ncbi:uncharacterized protein LOC111622448 isoform X2 [Centruroides sculpturatus]|uniref:uncharacterized protein LOC111622448 isoform X2 n=1 Tax=Centruroides sculpturatus TaxID=218467 RepID=UPI000C6E06B8|nr:uncharacterized protein LOC111622448 isoform X2 [Centruroides sculpturatus]
MDYPELLQQLVYGNYCDCNVLSNVEFPLIYKLKCFFCVLDLELHEKICEISNWSEFQRILFHQKNIRYKGNQCNLLTAEFTD